MKVGMYGASFFKMLAPFFFILSLCSKSEIDLQECIKIATQLKQNNTIDAVYFTPDQAILLKQILIGFIELEKKEIKVALFRFTDKDISQALARAKERGVMVELVVDSGATSLLYYSKVHAVAAQSVPIYIYQSMLVAGNYKSIMHQKTFIFGDVLDTSIVYSGSLNPTHAAFNGNEEMVMIRNAEKIVTAFNEQFKKLKSRSYKYEMVERSKKKKYITSKKKNKKNRLRELVLHYHDSFLADVKSISFY